MGSVADAVGSALRAEGDCEPDLAVAARCGSALRQHRSGTVCEHDGSVRRPLHGNGASGSTDLSPTKPCSNLVIRIHIVDSPISGPLFAEAAVKMEKMEQT